MKMKKLGRTGLMVTENSFGALPIQRIDKQSAVELLHMAYDGGINYYDTARAYTDSEEKLGEAFHDRRDKDRHFHQEPGQDKASKCWTDLDTSLKQLRTDYVDILQLHNIPAVPDLEDENGPYHALVEAKKQGQMPVHRRHLPPAAMWRSRRLKTGLYDTLQFPVSHISPQADHRPHRSCAPKAERGLYRHEGPFRRPASPAPRRPMPSSSSSPTPCPIWGIQKKEELQQFLDCAAAGCHADP